RASQARPPQEALRAGIAPVEGADADARPFGDFGDGGARIGDEHLPSRVQDQMIVAGRLRPAPAQRPGCFHGSVAYHQNRTFRSAIMEWNSPFRWPWRSRRRPTAADHEEQQAENRRKAMAAPETTADTDIRPF